MEGQDLKLGERVRVTMAVSREMPTIAEHAEQVGVIEKVTKLGAMLRFENGDAHFFLCSELNPE